MTSIGYTACEGSSVQPASHFFKVRSSYAMSATDIGAMKSFPFTLRLG